LNLRSYYYNCSPDYIASIDLYLHEEVEAIIRMLPKRETQSKINEDLFWRFTHKDWCYDTVPANSAPECPFELDLMGSIEIIKDRNLRDLFLTSITMDTTRGSKGRCPMIGILLTVLILGYYVNSCISCSDKNASCKI